MNFEQTPEFSKELKKFSKKWRTIPSDLEILKSVISALYIGADNLTAEHVRNTFLASNKGTVLRSISKGCEVVKVCMDCAALNSNKILRVTYIRNDNGILMVELYAKNDKPREDQARIQKYLKGEIN